MDAEARSLDHTVQSGTAARRNIVWLASYPKSGNTWVRVFVHNLLRELRGDTLGSADINDLGRFAIWEQSLPHFTRVLGKAPQQATMAELAQARPLVQRLISSEIPNNAIAKTHLCFGLDHGFPTIDLAVTKKIVYILRDPRDVAVSYAHHCSTSLDATIDKMTTRNFVAPGNASHVPETLGSWSQHVDSWRCVTTRPIHMIRYEHMLETPNKTFGDLAAFLDLTPTRGQLSEAIAKSSFDALAKQELDRGFRERPRRMERFFRMGKAGAWTDEMSVQQAGRLLSSLSRTATQLYS